MEQSDDKKGRGKSGNICGQLEEDKSGELKRRNWLRRSDQGLETVAKGKEQHVQKKQTTYGSTQT